VICFPSIEDKFKNLFLLLSSLAIVFTLQFDSASARDPREDIHIKRFINSSDTYESRMDNRQFVSSSLDTYNIVRYDFENRDWQGWTRVDNTAQLDTFFHADDFMGLGGGDFGRLTPLSGSVSMWCGCRPDTADEYLCGWISLPGYGNGWEQMLVSDRVMFAGHLNLSSRIRFDTEPDYDYIYVEYLNSSGDWEEVANFSGAGDSVVSFTINPASIATKIRFRFVSDGAWSDQDGLFNTDGAVIIDDISLSDERGLIDFEDFESWFPGEKSNKNSIWHADVSVSFGRYSGLWQGLVSHDPCDQNFSTQIVFFAGSDQQNPSYPGLYDTPFCIGSGGTGLPCQNEMVISPVIDLTKYSTGRNYVQDGEIPPGELSKYGGILLYFSVYRDLPLQNLVFYTWKIRNIDENCCPAEWVKREFVYYGTDGYYRAVENIADLVSSDKIQISLGIMDMCYLWYQTYGNCSDHTPAPWFDNVEVRRYSIEGPQWYCYKYKLFQDNFPSDPANIESYVRADIADDINVRDNPEIRPGDSVVVRCYSPLAGSLGSDNGGPAVYMHVRVHYIGDPSSPKPDIAGPILEGNCGRYKSDDGVWTIIQGDSARSATGLVAPELYAFDLNDSLLTRGYRIDYYFSAVDADGKSSVLMADERRGYYFEWTCLPTLRSNILYVDDYDGIGTSKGLVQEYFDNTFGDVLSPDNLPDRYDVLAPTSLVSNSLASRAHLNHLKVAYRKIIWDSGNLDIGTICDGVSSGDKSNDCLLLKSWLDQADTNVGLWILGDDIASELSNSTSPDAQALLNDYCGVSLANFSYHEVTGGFSGGGVVSPLVKGCSEGIFYHADVADSFYVYGGCPYINKFDCLEKVGSSSHALSYPVYNGTEYYAGIQNERVNSMGRTVRTMWFGFSFMYVRDVLAEAPIIRNHLLSDIIRWFENETKDDITGSNTTPAYVLGQNYPNPFNPLTTIKFGIKKRCHVTLKVYDVSGRLVKVLIDDFCEAGTYSRTWDGTNELGKKVASGVYFYRMETEEYSNTKKMVLLR